MISKGRWTAARYAANSQCFRPARAKATFCDGHHSRPGDNASKERAHPRREMIMNRFAILAAFVSLCAVAASPLKAQEPTTEAPAAITTPVPGPTENATEKTSGMME